MLWEYPHGLTCCWKCLYLGKCIHVAYSVVVESSCKHFVPVSVSSCEGISFFLSLCYYNFQKREQTRPATLLNKSAAFGSTVKQDDRCVFLPPIKPSWKKITMPLTQSCCKFQHQWDSPKFDSVDDLARIRCIEERYNCTPERPGKNKQHAK